LPQRERQKCLIRFPPDEGEHAPGEAADEPHQDGEVGDDDGEHDGHHHDQYPEPETPNFQLTIQGPNRWKHCSRLALKFKILAGY